MTPIHFPTPTMKAECSVNGKSHPSLGERLIAHIVQTVPDGLALCEFNCSVTQCSEETWSHCKRRLDALEQGKQPCED